METIIKNTLELVSDTGILVLGKFFQDRQDYILQNYNGTTVVPVDKYNTKSMLTQDQKSGRPAPSRPAQGLDEDHVAHIEFLMKEKKR